MPASASAFVPDLYNETNIDWDVKESCSIPESAEETDIMTERGWAVNAYEDTSSVAGRPQSPVILGLVELQQAKGFTGWETPADAEIVPTGWDMPPEAGPEATGWENNVQQFDTWAVPAQLATVHFLSTLLGLVPVSLSSSYSLQNPFLCAFLCGLNEDYLSLSCTSPCTGGNLWQLPVVPFL